MSIPTNVIPPSLPFLTTAQTATNNIVYVRTTGSDSTGDGSLANPFRTFVHAIQTVPLSLGNAYYTVDITGIGTESIGTDYVWPAFQGGSNPLVANLNTLQNVKSQLNIYAAPTVQDTLNAGTTVWTQADSDIGLATLTDSSKTWTTNQWKGFLLLGANPGEVCQIASNTATALELCLDISGGAGAQFHAPITICSQSADLQGTLGSGNSIAQHIEMGCSLSLLGVKFSSSNGGTPLYMIGVPRLVISGCDFPGGCILNFQEATHVGCHFKTTFVYGGGMIQSQSNFFDACTTWQINRQPSGLWLGANIFDGCAALGHRLLDSNSTLARAPATFFIKRCVIRNGTSHGVQFYGGARCAMHRVMINNCAGSGIYAEGPGQLWLTGLVKSTTNNSRYGVELVDGAHVKVADTVNTRVTGTLGDTKTGTLAAQAWTDWVTAGGAFDLTANTGDGSRLGV